MAFITYSLAYLDRANFGFGAAGGMAEDLNITAAMSSLLGSLFFLGYFFFQIPGALYAANRSAKKLIFWSLILWGGAGDGNWYDQQRQLAYRNSVYAGCRGKRCDALHADLTQQVVYKIGTFKSEYFFNSRKPGNDSMDVYSFRIPHQFRRMAVDVYS